MEFHVHDEFLHRSPNRPINHDGENHDNNYSHTSSLIHDDDDHDDDDTFGASNHTTAAAAIPEKMMNTNNCATSWHERMFMLGDYGSCNSPMVTHFHRLTAQASILKQQQNQQQQQQHYDDSALLNWNKRKSTTSIGTAVDRTRSKSLGAESDLLLPLSYHHHHDDCYPQFQQQQQQQLMPLSSTLFPPKQPIALPHTSISSPALLLSTDVQQEHHNEPQQQQQKQQQHLVSPQHDDKDHITIDKLHQINNNNKKKQSKSNPLYISLLYGVINAFIVLPVLMSFGSIIYRDTAFSPYMPVLIKLTIVSGMVHQICFSTFSSLPFSVGQVQDAGLIFLSKMAAALVQHCRLEGHDEDGDDRMLATVTVGLSLATALLGVGLILLGRLECAQYVQRLPMPVIGGYLAFIGYFCGISGMALMANGGGGTISWTMIQDNILFILPGLVGGILIYASVRTIRHMAVLPISIVVLLSIFYSVLWTTNTSIAQATQYGWIRPSDPPPTWYHTWDYLRLDLVAWEAFPSQIPILLSMIFVVALSSSLDVAAIELELKSQEEEEIAPPNDENTDSTAGTSTTTVGTGLLNYNAELTMVGISNVVSGLTGGYTGSYIFSQSIFSLRAGITSRMAGYCLAVCQGLVWWCPIPILTYIPNCFFGSLLIMICVDLMYEWLWEVRNTLSTLEYSICLATFGFIQWIGVEYGILVGVLLHMGLQKLGLLHRVVVVSQFPNGTTSSTTTTTTGELPDSNGSYGGIDCRQEKRNNGTKTYHVSGQDDDWQPEESPNVYVIDISKTITSPASKTSQHVIKYGSTE